MSSIPKPRIIGPNEELKLLPFTIETVHAQFSDISSSSSSSCCQKPSVSCFFGKCTHTSHHQGNCLILKLQALSIVYTFSFGKKGKAPFPAREFKVYGGAQTDCPTQLLHAAVPRSDDDLETYSLQYRTRGALVPIQYVKLVPNCWWGSSFNISNLVIQLHGDDDPAYVHQVQHASAQLAESEMLRMCLKHLRKRNLLDVYSLLGSRTGVKTEHPLLTRLHHDLVERGDFQACESRMIEAHEQGMLDHFLSECKYVPQWRRITPRPTDANGSTAPSAPRMRGGHQMCIDSEEQKIYLLGGWDGEKDLADFWMYDILKERWILISENTAQQGGPGPRSCHKICLDSLHKRIYILGRFVEADGRTQDVLSSDLCCYNTSENTWDIISSDTKKDGGPELIYDHQMCMDARRQVIYVFGGRFVCTSPEPVYSGLYKFDIASRTWTLLRADAAPVHRMVPLKSRIGHSMLFNDSENLLYILAGQRHKDYLSDFYVYNIDTDTVVEISRDCSRVHGPDAGFTQRATIDPVQGELYVLSGLMRDSTSLQDTIKNSFWVFNLKREQWMRIYQNENVDPGYWNKMHMVEPCPRFAHQLVLDCKNRVHYLFGGNPGVSPKERLDDFWSLSLTRPDSTSILRKAQFLIRKQRYMELCAAGSSDEALRFLQTDLASIVDLSDPQKLAEFHSLGIKLLHAGASADAPQTFSSPPYLPVDAVFRGRTELFSELMRFFPQQIREPAADLVDLFYAQ